MPSNAQAMKMPVPAPRKCPSLQCLGHYFLGHQRLGDQPLRILFRNHLRGHYAWAKAAILWETITRWA
jgi:hypothetical protein